MPRKGQDTLILAMPAILAQIPDAVLLVVGGGPYAEDLRRLAEETGVRDAVRFTGAVPWAELPAHYGAGDVFAMPCRTRRGGLDVEGLGIVYLEASATGLPVVAGDSGGAPDAVLDGETGWVVRGGSAEDAADRIVTLLGTRSCGSGWGSAAGPGSRRSGAGTCWRRSSRPCCDGDCREGPANCREGARAWSPGASPFVRVHRSAAVDRLHLVREVLRHHVALQLQ